MNVSIAENACRVCLIEQEIMINLFDTVEDFQKKRLSELLENCSDLKIDTTDNTPKLICDECTSELLVAAKFREKCKRTLDILAQVCYDEKAEIARFEDESLEDDDNIIVEEQEPEDDEGVGSGRGSPQPEMIYEEVDFVDDELQDEQIILVEHVMSDKISMKTDSATEEIHEQNDDMDLYERVITAACNSKTSKTLVTSKPLIINCICDACGAAFTHVINLSRHMQTHQPDQVFTCSICKYPFTKYETYKSHIDEHEHDDEIIENIIVQDSYEIKEELSEDAGSPARKKILLASSETEKAPAQIEETKKSRICLTCNKPFVSKSALEAHMRIHTGDRPFKCDICPKSFTTQGGLALHLRRHSGLRPYNCNVCEKSFIESSNLRVHMRTHTGEKPHTCTICSRSFTRVFLLQIHLRTHTGERPYQCPYCSKTFSQGGDLASHKRIHTGERPHVCRYCNKGFIKSSGLTQHMRKHSKLEIEANSPMYDGDIKSNKRDSFDILVVDEDENNLGSEIDEEIVVESRAEQLEDNYIEYSQDHET